jgi:hypothetical protein
MLEIAPQVGAVTVDVVGRGDCRNENGADVGGSERENEFANH